tara:strand:+ start:295 stop:771 length:477 start_codon:yes stop_codon:yes gene_type:complete
MELVEIVIIIFSIIFSLLSFFPIIPCIELLLFMTFLAWTNSGKENGLWPLIIGVLIWVLNSVIEHLIRTGVLKKNDSSKGTPWACLGGILIFSPVIPPWGIFIGAFVGSFLWEMKIHGSKEKSYKVAKGALLGVLASGFGRFLFSLIYLIQIFLLTFN